MDQAPRDRGDRVAAVVAMIILPFAIYLAAWQIDWGDGGFFTRYVLPVVFCVAIPSIVGSLIALPFRRRS